MSLEHPHPIRLLVVDDHAPLRSDLITYLEGLDDMEIAGEATNGEEAIILRRYFRFGTFSSHRTQALHRVYDRLVYPLGWARRQ